MSRSVANWYSIAKRQLLSIAHPERCYIVAVNLLKMTIQSSGSLYSTHAARPRKRPAPATLMRAVKKVMKAELGSVAIARWHTLLDEEIGESVFSDPLHAQPASITKIWCPTKPRVARILAQALQSQELLSDGKPVAVTAPLTLGSEHQGCLSKLISRRLVDMVIAKYGQELRECGEIRIDLFAENAEKQLAASIARPVTDLLTYATARAKELVRDGERVVIEMQTVDQTLHGRETRGSGLVVCEKGMALIEKIAHEIINKPLPGGAAHVDEEGQQVQLSSSDGEDDV
jgi:hypothetical protein